MQLQLQYLHTSVWRVQEKMSLLPFTYTCTFYQAVSTRLLISAKKASPLLVLISGLPPYVQYSDTYEYNKAAVAEARSVYFTSISGFSFVLRHFSHYCQLICISIRIKTFQVRFLPLLTICAMSSFTTFRPAGLHFNRYELSLFSFFHYLYNFLNSPTNPLARARAHTHTHTHTCLNVLLRS